MEEFKTQELPLSRIKKLMKFESELLDESAKYMVSCEAPILFAKACEIFILELSLRSWKFADDERRRTLLSSDITKAVSRSEMYDFLIDIIPREDIKIPEYLQHQLPPPSSAVPAPSGSGPQISSSSSSSSQFRPLTTSISSGPPAIAPTPTYIPYNYAAVATHPGPVGEGVSYYPAPTGAAGGPSPSESHQMIYYPPVPVPSSAASAPSTSAPPPYHPQATFYSSPTHSSHPAPLPADSSHHRHQSPPQLLPGGHYSHYQHPHSPPPTPSSSASPSTSVLVPVPAPPSHEYDHGS